MEESKTLLLLVSTEPMKVFLKMKNVQDGPIYFNIYKKTPCDDCDICFRSHDDQTYYCQAK